MSAANCPFFSSVKFTEINLLRMEMSGVRRCYSVGQCHHLARSPVVTAPADRATNWSNNPFTRVSVNYKARQQIVWLCLHRRRWTRVASCLNSYISLAGPTLIQCPLVLGCRRPFDKGSIGVAVNSVLRMDG